jgi:hypothetical protein
MTRRSQGMGWRAAIPPRLRGWEGGTGHRQAARHAATTRPQR